MVQSRVKPVEVNVIVASPRLLPLTCTRPIAAPELNLRSATLVVLIVFVMALEIYPSPTVPVFAAKPKPA